MTPFIPAAYSPTPTCRSRCPASGWSWRCVFITLLGFLTANLVGRTAGVAGAKSLLGRMPVVRNLYRGLKQIFETVLSNRAKSFQTVGLIEYPRKGLWAIVFIATGTRGEVGHRLDTEDDDASRCSCRRRPNPTSGFLLFVRESEVIGLDMTVEDAAKLVISAGLVSAGIRPVTKPRSRRRRPSAVDDRPTCGNAAIGVGATRQPALSSRTASSRPKR